MEKSERIAAATIFAAATNIGDALLHCSMPDKGEHSAILLWHAISRLKNCGIKVLNLGGAKSKGLNVFKERFGAISKPMISVNQSYRKDIYKLLCDEAGVDPNEIDGFFPAYRRNK